MNSIKRICKTLLASLPLLAGCTEIFEEETLDLENLHYELPVIFHVLYQEKGDPMQYVAPDRLAELLETVNEKYSGSEISSDMNLSFVMAATDENGDTLDTAGVEYIYWNGDYPIDCHRFMDNRIDESSGIIWDPNKYINIFVYNFASTDSYSVTLGISHLPYTTSGETSLPGLTEISASHIDKNDILFPYSVSINSLFIDQQSTATTYNSADISVTLSHELGHYLGLLHVFYEDDDDGCEDSDYCTDTPCYNYPQYQAYAMKITAAGEATFDNLVKRTSCNGTVFTSRNIMDYGVSYSNQFTQDQRSRIRHVLNFSPMIPGPKATADATKGHIHTDLPIRTMEREIPVR